MRTSLSYLSKKVAELQPSGIRRFFDLASTMEDVISLGVGEPDFVTPWNVIEASYHSLEKGYTAYTANAGMIELRRLIEEYLAEQFNVRYNAEDQILVTVGASQAIDLSIRALIDPGDEVIIAEPCFVAYAPIVSLAGGIPVPVDAHAENAFRLQPEQLEAAVTNRTKAVLICSPNNPTGAVLRTEELIGIAAVVENHDLIVISDEIYAELTYDEGYTSLASLEQLKERTLLVSGFSKAFAMTGWRLGYVAGPSEWIQAMLKIHQYTMMCASTMAQHGAIEALKNGRESMLAMKKSYKQRRNFIVNSLNDLGLECHRPGGAFYVFPSVKSTGLTSEAFAEKLLQEEHVAVVPGHVFGKSGEGYIRCSYATSLKQLDEAIKRIQRFLQRL
ncbi:aminotransferase [Pullulanibacillus camelliae]|uniref:Aminotransferase n=1 Tax=Pullulanibacillus camelliae TaxID=1707096 RepID=A0A8J2YKV2_9BACL|nr:aminotransferase [Pullulanibacillus camelliae]GGE49311.1 aminotransferase [Pullulanibacillus camelliae]